MIRTGRFRAPLAAIKDASAENRYAILVAAGSYNESRIAMKPYVDLYGGYSGGDWKERDVYLHATILDAAGKGPVVIAADHARLDGFVITGGPAEGPRRRHRLRRRLAERSSTTSSSATTR